MDQLSIFSDDLSKLFDTGLTPGETYNIEAAVISHGFEGPPSVFTETLSKYIHAGVMEFIQFFD